jgi:carbamoyl-phosphate synthase large subunit
MAAYDCVANHVRAFLGEAIEDLDPYENQYIARRYEEHVMRVEDSAL